MKTGPGKKSSARVPVAVVTGAGSGVGRACALRLAVAGWRVALVSRRATALQQTIAAAGEYPASLELIASGRINVDGLISARPPLEEGADWFRRLQAGEAGLMKVVLCP